LAAQFRVHSSFEFAANSHYCEDVGEICFSFHAFTDYFESVAVRLRARVYLVVYRNEFRVCFVARQLFLSCQRVNCRQFADIFFKRMDGMSPSYQGDTT